MAENTEIKTEFIKYSHPIPKKIIKSQSDSEVINKSKDKSAKDLGTESLQTVLDSMFDIKTRESGDYIYESHVSTIPSTRLEVISLKERLDTALHTYSARETGLCPIRRQLYDQCFDELIRQVTVECVDRGLLLYCIRNEIKMTFMSLEYIRESAVAFGLRAALRHNAKKFECEEKANKLKTENEELSIKLDKTNRELTDLREDRNRLIEDMKEFYENKFEKLNQIITAQRTLIDSLKRKPLFV